MTLSSCLKGLAALNREILGNAEALEHFEKLKACVDKAIEGRAA